MNAFRDWLNTVFGADGGRAVQMVLALVVVVLLLLAATWLFRRLFAGTLHRGKGGRLSVIDATSIDHHRRLLLLRRDDVEHLVMIGGPNDLLVESRILRAPPVVAGRPVTAAAQPIITAAPPPPPPAQPAIAPAAAGPLEADPAPDQRGKPLAGGVTAAGVGAFAAAAAFVRSRASRAAEAPEPPREPEAAPPAAPAAPRRALDTAFDGPLGRPAAEPEPRGRGFFGARPAPEPSVVEPPPRASEARPVEPPRRPEPPRAPEPPVAVAPVPPPIPAAPTPAPVPPPAAPEPSVAPDHAERHRLVGQLERALDDIAQPRPEARRPPPRSLDDIDLLADLDQVVADLARPRANTAPIAAARPLDPPPPVEPVTAPLFPELEPIVPPHGLDAPARHEPRFAEADRAPPVEIAPPSEPHPDQTVLPLDSDFISFTPMPAPRAEPRPEPRPVPPPVAPVPPPVAVPVPPPPRPEPMARPEPVVAPPVEVAPEPTVDTAPPVAPPPAKAPVDELEEEMARLLSELSGATRR